MSKRLLKEAEDDTDEESDGWFAQFNAVTSAQKSSEDAPVHSLPPTSKRTKKTMFLDDIDDDDDDEREEEEKNHSSPLCENLFGSINTVTAEKILTKLSSHKDIGNSQRSNSTSNSAEPKTQQREPHDDFRDGYSESSGRASICISDEFRPVFDINFKRADKTIHLRSPSQFSHVDFLLNHHIARYLLDHQVEGILWLWSKYLDGKGVILADDMGMGKTIQITALISILFCKTGVGTTDLSRMRLRRQKETTTLSSSSSASFTKSHVSPSVEYYLQTKPCLIACPKSLVDNWYKEIQKWGYFTVDILNSKLDEQQRENIIDRADQGRSEIVLVSYSQIGKFHSRLSSISWSMIVFDEGHILKNTGIQLYQKILDIKKTTFRLVATGTPIQNDLLELWSILHLIDAYTFANRQDFVKEYEKPIKLGMRSSADHESVAEGMLASRKLASLLEIYMLGRKKKLLESGAVEVSNHEDQVDDKQALLKGKDEVIVLCDLSPIQQELYQHCLSLPDFDNIRYHTSMCSCGSGKTRGKCCPHYRIPYRRDTAGNVLEPLTIDPRAAMWSNFHQNNEPCGDDKTQRCPLCVLLPCLSILSKIACHPALLQHDPNSARADKQEKLKRFVSHALTPDLVEKMGGPLRSTKFMDMKSTALSGKMKTLQDMLDVFVRDGQKTLVFSLSTQVLDMIEALVRSRGWTSLRLDGQTPSHRRQQLVDEFNDKSHISVFLISSRAGGLGLNLCTATKVIIFDVDWNPVVDMQSQDRAYRIGQKEHLVVYRLVSKGTIEEMTYMRQLYKQQLQNAVPMWQSGSTSTVGFKRGRFEGVEGDANMRGELFGIENLLQFSTSSILHSLRIKYREKKAERKSINSPTGAQYNAPSGVEGMSRMDVDEVMNMLVEDLTSPHPFESRILNHSSGESNKSLTGLDLLESIGINVKNAHLLDEMLDGSSEENEDNFSAIDGSHPSKLKRLKTSQKGKSTKKKTVEINYSSGPTVPAGLHDSKGCDVIQFDLLELDNQSTNYQNKNSIFKRNTQQQVVNLADSDIDDVPGRTTRADPTSSAAPPNKSSSVSNQQETTMEPTKLAEIFVRRVIKPKIDTNIPAKIGNFTSAASPATTETQPLVATSASSTEVLPVNNYQKRSIPGNLRRPGLNKGSMSNQQTSVGLYLPKYN